MSFWLWIFLIFFTLLMVPVSWAVSHAVGMERASWGRALAFSLIEALVALLAIEAFPLDFFVLEALAGVFAGLFVSPLVFRLLMTHESARALLGAFLLTVVSVGGSVLFILL